MRELPIIFSAPMVRAILEGRKTVTRRVVKPQPTLPTDRWVSDSGGSGKWMAEGPSPPTGGTRQTMPWKLCPYGQPGDRLWVRETWQYFGFSDEGEPCICYLADHGREWPHVPQSEVDKVDCIWADLSDPGNFSISGRACDNRWRPSIHMPRWASRITLEVTSVRVERLKDITPAQILAEGVQIPSTTEGQALIDISTKHGPAHFLPKLSGATTDALLRAHWAALWVSISGIDSWNANPWVWVVEFQRIHQAYAEATAA